MRLLVGLGNPGSEYAGTRHNLGFSCLDALAKAVPDVRWKEFKDGALAQLTLGKSKALLFKPLQYMNNSGQQVRQVTEFYQTSPADLAVVCDDVYIHPGTARIRRSGGDGGHNGIKSLHDHLKTEDFWRIKIGAGLYEQDLSSRHRLPPLEEYVLQKLPPHDLKNAQAVIDRLVPDLLTWLEHGTGLSQKTVHI